jgi:hypothetical protein
MIEPSQYKQYPTDEDLLKALREKVEQADSICIILSETVGTSEYVQAEINEAQRLLGRIIFFHDTKHSIPNQIQWNDPGPISYNVNFEVKHTIVGISLWNDKTLEELAIQIINDPDEGWFENISQIPKWWRKRDLHTECVLRRYVRECMHVDPHTQSHTIHEVMPLIKSWDYPRDDQDAIFEWYVKTFGNINLLDKIRKGKCDAMITWYYIDREDLISYTENGWITVLYLRDSIKKNTVMLNNKISSGKYPVPSDQTCQWPDCKSHANGSIGSNEKRVWFCLKHLKEIPKIISESDDPTMIK